MTGTVRVGLGVEPTSTWLMAMPEMAATARTEPLISAAGTASLQAMVSSGISSRSMGQ